MFLLKWLVSVYVVCPHSKDMTKVLKLHGIHCTQIKLSKSKFLVSETSAHGLMAIPRYVLLTHFISYSGTFMLKLSCLEKNWNYNKTKGHFATVLYIHQLLVIIISCCGE